MSDVGDALGAQLFAEFLEVEAAAAHFLLVDYAAAYEKAGPTKEQRPQSRMPQGRAGDDDFAAGEHDDG